MLDKFCINFFFIVFVVVWKQMKIIQLSASTQTGCYLCFEYFNFKSVVFKMLIQPFEWFSLVLYIWFLSLFVPLSFSLVCFPSILHAHFLTEQKKKKRCLYGVCAQNICRRFIVSDMIIDHSLYKRVSLSKEIDVNWQMYALVLLYISNAWIN